MERIADLADRYRYRAGQFLTFRVTHPDGAFNRCYSLSSAPETDGQMKVTVKRVTGGRGSNWFHDELAERTAAFRAVNTLVERAGRGIEIFCLARPTDSRVRGPRAGAGEPAGHRITGSSDANGRPEIERNCNGLP